MRKLLGLIGLGAALTYFFNPMEGQRRRAKIAGRIRALLARAEAGPKLQPDDVTLARKVETEIFRPEDAPKGQVDVNVENGIVFLRGEVERPEIIKDLEGRARKVQGVREVENLLHLPGSPSPAAKGKAR